MSVQLTQKERSLFKDLQSHEKICIQKYQEYASKASDPALKQLFTKHAGHEQQHYQTLEQILNGQIPNMSQQSQQGQQQQEQQRQQVQQTPMMQQASPGMQSSAYNQQDAFLCNDLLMTEKYVSGNYDTVIFESVDTNIRQALNHIQKEEQKHGEEIFKYMQTHGMYTPQ